MNGTTSGIRVLDSETINRIAAGEVIERPASIVKELVENALDADASSVTIEIRDGGISLIRVTDNGKGIPEEEVRNAFLRHATSKIRTAEDLLLVSTLGFRGEALASIAAVSRTEMITKTRAALTGTRYVIEGGEERALEAVGAPEGTTVIVRDLFYCVPVRKKFLKSASTETAHVAELAEQLALSSPETSFRLIINGQRRFGTSGNGSIKDIVYQLYGRDLSAGMVEAEWQDEFFRLSGFLGKPEVSRQNRAMEHFTVNGRYIKSPVLRKALEDGYGNLLMQHAFPAAFLDLRMDPVRVDVNVHPSKREVRFSDPQAVYDFLKEAVQKSLKRHELIREVRLSSPKEAEQAFRGKDEVRKPKRPPEPFETKRARLEGAASRQTEELQQTEEIQEAKGTPENGAVQTAGYAKQEGNTRTAGYAEREGNARTTGYAQREGNARAAGYALTEGSPSFVRSRGPETGAAFTGTPPEDSIIREERGGQLSFVDPSHRASVRLIGEAFDTYLLAEWEGALYIIDQHAAHEKVNYERLISSLKESRVLSQELLPPVILNLTDREADLLGRHLSVFQNLGYRIEDFGLRSFVVRAVPDLLPSVMKEELLREMISELSEETGAPLPERLLLKTASLSCKAAVKGNQSLSASEAEKLLDDLFSLEDPYNCPHGRPTIIKLTKYELDRRFRRIV